MFKNLSAKKLFIFDLDGTLTASKSAATPKMAKLIAALLNKKRVAIISGGKFSQFKMQLLSKLEANKIPFQNLTIFPTNSTSLYVFKKNKWGKVYEQKLSPQEKKEIKEALRELRVANIYKKPAKIYDKIIEDRGTQITFSALGQRAPVKAKETWNINSDLRSEYISILKRKLKKFEIKKGGLTSIDITRKGIDKAYGVKKILKELKISKRDAVFIGDAFYKGGNDAPARKAGIDCVPVSGPEETEKIIKEALVISHK